MSCTKRVVNPVGILKRSSSSKETDLDICVFCQEQKEDHLNKCVSIETKHKVKECLSLRRKYRDEDKRVMLDRLEALEQIVWENDQPICWHKSCYATFTSKHNITRLQRRHQEKSTLECHMEDDTLPSSSMNTRSQPSNLVDWDKCIFCQTEDKNTKIHTVKTLDKSTKIMNMAKHNSAMHFRLSGTNDLIAASGKYHQKCLLKFERDTLGCDRTSGGSADAMVALCTQLEVGLNQGHVYDMGKVWDTYVETAGDLSCEIPASYLSRRQSFYNDVEQRLGGKARFVRPLDSHMHLMMYPGDRSDYVIRHSLCKQSGSDLFSSSNESELSEVSESENNAQTKTFDSTFQEMVHVAMTIRTDLDQTAGHEDNWQNINVESAKEIIPNSLYLFLILLFGGMSAVEDITNEEAYEANTDMNRRVLSVAQDIVYGVSKGQKLTPKHVGLGLTLHQATRSENLVNLFSAANHCIPIWTVRDFDNAIANRIIDRYKNNGYVYIPPSLETGVFTHFSCDNVDVLECTLDGKNTFHSTQMMAWQRSTDTGPRSEELVGPVNTNVIDKDAMKVYQTIDDANMTKGKRKSPPDEVYRNEEDVTAWLNDNNEQKKDISNLTWTLVRRFKNSDKQKYPLWGAFQESITTEQHDLTNACMLPILSAPADEYDTIATVINKFQAISQKIGQTHTVITADQPLYSKGQELVWANREGRENVIFMMGGLHICFNFLRAIGQHMECSGLEDVLLEAGVFGPNAAASALEGKHYYRAVRGHQLTYEALWRLKWRYFEKWLLATNRELPTFEHELTGLASAFSQLRPDRALTRELIEDLQTSLEKEQVVSLLVDFDNEMRGVKNYAFWNSYLRMVEILLGFIKAQRTGNWPLHVETFAAMLPWLSVYDHTNYARWGPIYLTDMKNLESTAPAVYSEFMDGNFVVKMSKHFFNEVPADQATEWMNKMCKATGGIIGITRKDTARDRFCVTWSVRSQVSRDTGNLFEQFSDEEETDLHRKDSTPARINAEEEKVETLVHLLETQDVFRLPSKDKTANAPGNELVAISSKDVASDDICQDLLSCESRGKKLVEGFIRTRLSERSTDFYAPLPKNKSKTFAHLYRETSGTQQRTLKILKADRKLLQRLFNAASSGRDVQTAEVLEYELSPVPLSLADASGQMNSTPKAQILNVLTSDRGIDTPPRVPASDIPTCVIVDGHALVQAIGKPQGCNTFGDYADVYVQAVYRHFGNSVTRVDVAFDRYLGGRSIKVTTRTKRKGKRRPIRKLVTNRDTPLPQVWEQYISQEDNKSDLAEFLSNELMGKSDNLPNGSTMVVGGGYRSAINARSSSFNADHLSANHEEADTRMIVHAKDAVARGYGRLEVISRDTDVLLLLVYHFGEDVECWMVSGTGRSRRCYPIHTISLTLDRHVRESILGFHALTGCDTTSSFHGIGKKSCWKTYCEAPTLLAGVGRDGDASSVARYLCGLYGCSKEHEPDINTCRYRLFMKARKSLEMLPPTADALELHVKRAYYQAKLWINADIANSQVDTPLSSEGWHDQDGVLVPKWTRKAPVPRACAQLVSCGCKTKCSTARCKCYQAGQICMFECSCEAKDCSNPM